MTRETLGGSQAWETTVVEAPNSYTDLFPHLVATDGTTTYAAAKAASEVFSIHASDLANSICL